MLDLEHGTDGEGAPAAGRKNEPALGDSSSPGGETAAQTTRTIGAFVPDAPEGYQLPDAWKHDEVPEEIARRVASLLENDKDDFKRFCHSAAMTDEQAGKAFAALGLIMAEHLATCSMAEGRDVDAALALLAPANPAEYWQTAKRGARHLNIGSALDEAGLTANPLVLRLAHAVGALTGEDSMRGTAKTPRSLPFGAEARSEMLKAMQTDGYKKNDPAVMRLVEQLAARVTR